MASHRSNDGTCGRKTLSYHAHHIIHTIQKMRLGKFSSSCNKKIKYDLRTCRTHKGRHSNSVTCATSIGVTKMCECTHGPPPQMIVWKQIRTFSCLSPARVCVYVIKPKHNEPHTIFFLSFSSVLGFPRMKWKGAQDC